MGRVSNRKNKKIYQKCRENLGLSREKASELLKTISADRIDKIESEKFTPYPEEVYEMAKIYKRPDLCNYFCTHECAIGQNTMSEIKIKDLSQIVLEMIASLNSMRYKQERLIEITVDGIIQDDEIKDLIMIQKDLDKITMTTETLRLWVNQMLANNKIDQEKYEFYKEK